MGLPSLYLPLRLFHFLKVKLSSLSNSWSSYRCVCCRPAIWVESFDICSLLVAFGPLSTTHVCFLLAVLLQTLLLGLRVFHTLGSHVPLTFHLSAFFLVTANLHPSVSASCGPYMRPHHGSGHGGRASVSFPRF